MALDHQLPVWGVRPNWSQSIIETLTWHTDVLQSLSGAEQRIAQRIAPRRMFEARFNPHESERSFVDLAMHRLSRNEWMMPLWWDRATLSAPAVAGASRIALDTTFHEFVEGGMAYLVGQDTFSGEAVRIASIDATGIDLVTPLGSAWAAGTSIHPMRRGWFEEGSHVLLTSRLGESNIRFHVIEGNDLSDEGTWAASHEGMPVLLDQPDWSNSIEIDLSFLGDEFDSITGKKRVTDTAGRTFRQQQHRFFLSGAREQFAFRQMIYRMRGQQKAIWLPTFADDIEVAANASAGATLLNIKQIGLAYVGGPVDGRDRLVFSDGQVVKINGSTLVSGSGQERLTLASGLAAPKAVGARASFIEKVRLAQDSVEIEHVGDSDGFALSTLSFRAFADRRVASSASSAIPVAVMDNAPCGSASGVFNLDANSFNSANRSSGGLVLQADSTSDFLVIEKPSVFESGGQLLYDAYSLWPNDAENDGRTWQNRFLVLGFNGVSELILFEGDPELDPPVGSYFATKAEAFSALSALSPLVFTGYLRYRITCIVDSNLGDNRGGISVRAYITDEEPN